MKFAMHCTRGFSLAEMLIVISIIAIIAGLVVPAITGTRNYASQAVARQQQAELQTALGNWISRESSQPGGLARARSNYNSEPDKLSLLSDYLQASTLANLSSTGSVVSSTALLSSGARLYFSSIWTPTNAPTITWSNAP